MSTVSLRHPVTMSCAVAVAFWIPAAFAVAVVHLTAAKLVIILATAYAYMRIGARECTVDAALLAGIAWALLGIVAELVISAKASHGWFALLGSPRSAVEQDLLLMAWIAAPALFARRRS